MFRKKLKGSVKLFLKILLVAAVIGVKILLVDHNLDKIAVR